MRRSVAADDGKNTDGRPTGVADALFLQQLERLARPTRRPRGGNGGGARPAVERAAHGKSLRRKVPRSTLARWPPPSAPESRSRSVQEALGWYAAMPGAMAERLTLHASPGLMVQLAGDARPDALVLVTGSTGRMMGSLWEFGHSCAGPFEWDVKRLVAGIELRARAHGHDGAHRAELTENATHAYRRAVRKLALIPATELWSDRWAPAWRAGWPLDAFRRIPVPTLTVPRSDELVWARGALRAYRRSLGTDSRSLVERYRVVAAGAPRRERGSAGSVDILMDGDAPGDRVVLRAETVAHSTRGAKPERGSARNDARRIADAQRTLSALRDPFVGWARVPSERGDRDVHIRRLYEHWVPELRRFSARDWERWARICGRVLALAHARSGDAVAIGAYLGRSDAFERALMRFAAAYADDLLRGTGPDSRWGTLADVR